MSVPLDRLYHYLNSLVQEDILIYRFYPHGSKKLEDLLPLEEYVKSLSWVDHATSPDIFFHDQEPLNFDYYQWNDIESTVPKYKKCSPFALALTKELFKHANIQAVVSFPMCAIYDYTLLCHSEKNSKNLQLYEDKHFIGVYWWSHALIARDWFRYAEHDPELVVNFNKIKKDFLIYNRAWKGTREYRLKFADLLIDYNLVDCCLTSFAAFDSGGHYQEHLFENNAWKPMHRLEHYFKENVTNSTASADYENTDYQVIGIEVVLETLFDDQRLHLTEKSLRPIACGRPFILAGTPGSLQYLRDYGIKTFHGLIDETYDTITNPEDRLMAIVAEMKRISELDTASKFDLYSKLYQIAEENKKLFFSKEWQDKIVGEFQVNFQNAYKKLSQHKTGKWINYIRNFANTSKDFQKEFYSDSPNRSLNELQQVLSMVPRNQ